MSAYRPLAELSEALESATLQLAENHSDFRTHQVSLYRTGSSLRSLVTDLKHGHHLAKLDNREDHQLQEKENIQSHNHNDPFKD
jgi:hypothetical protein